MSGLHLDDLVAIDVHVHAELSSDGHPSLAPDLEAGKAAYFKAETPQPTVEEIAEHYRERRIAAVVFTVDAESATGHPPISNVEVADSCAEHADVLLPFASLDPHRGRTAVREARRLVEEHGVRGFKFHPSLQAFWPSDRLAYPLFELINDAGLTAVFHSGQTGLGRTLPGGGGVRLKFSNPMFLDDVAVDFPNMNIVIAHPSVPWQSEALAVCLHKQNVFIDLSGWSPKYFPDELVHYANTLIKHKVMFGTDFPLMTPERWTEDFAQRGFRDEVVEGIMKGNAARMLGLIDP